jgi:hypothetical protein
MTNNLNNKGMTPPTTTTTTNTHPHTHTHIHSHSQHIYFCRVEHIHIILYGVAVLFFCLGAWVVGSKSRIRGQRKDKYSCKMCKKITCGWHIIKTVLP